MPRKDSMTNEEALAVLIETAEAVLDWKYTIAPPKFPPVGTLESAIKKMQMHLHPLKEVKSSDLVKLIKEMEISSHPWNEPIQPKSLPVTIGIAMSNAKLKSALNNGATLYQALFSVCKTDFPDKVSGSFSDYLVEVSEFFETASWHVKLHPKSELKAIPQFPKDFTLNAKPCAATHVWEHHGVTKTCIVCGAKELNSDALGG